MVGVYTFWDAMWTMIVFFAWVMFVFWVIMLLVDNFRRSDHSGWAKAGWTLFLIFLPIIGAVTYTIVRPDITAPDLYYDAPRSGYAGSPAPAGDGGSSVATEIARLNELRTEGAITDAEFEDLKRKTIATA
jgi:hypothetical protein